MKVLLLAGEESGMIYARGIADALRRRDPSVEIRGYADYGFTTERLGVMGIDEVLKSIFYLLRVKRTMERAIADWRPDVLCTVDYPGMNMKLAAYARRLGIRTVHVVCPQVWAWKAGRIPRIERTFDHLCCFFPFEPALFRPGFAEFVGHPLVEAFGEVAERRVAAADGAVQLALLPGSRLGEITKHLPVMMAAVNALDGRFAVTIPAANERARCAIERVLAKCRRAERPVVVTQGGARELLLRADCAVVASGTATLEAALARCPTVLVYKAAPLFAFIARRVIKGIRFIGLANIIWDKCGGAGQDAANAPMPELLQEDFTAANLRRVLEPLLTDPTARAAATRRLDVAVRLLRSDGGAMERIAAMVLERRRKG